MCGWPRWGSSASSNRLPHAQEMLATFIGFIERNLELGAVGEIETEIIHV